MRALGAAAACAALLAMPAAAADRAWRPYDDPEGRFAVEFPRGWDVGLDPFRILVATAAPESSGDRFQETIKIVATDVAPGISVDAYYRSSLEVYKSLWKVHGAAAGRVAGARARRVIVDQTIGRRKTRLLKCFVLGQGRVFVITCASEPKAFARHMPIFEATLATFRILPPPGTVRPEPTGPPPVPTPPPVPPAPPEPTPVPWPGSQPPILPEPPGE
jgi:hypothetical protein